MNVYIQRFKVILTFSLSASFEKEKVWNQCTMNQKKLTVRKNFENWIQEE